MRFQLLTPPTLKGDLLVECVHTELEKSRKKNRNQGPFWKLTLAQLGTKEACA